MGDDQLESAERLDEIDFVFDHQVVSAALEDGVSFLLEHDDDIARVHVRRLVTFSGKANLLFVSTA